MSLCDDSDYFPILFFFSKFKSASGKLKQEKLRAFYYALSLLIVSHSV